MKKENEIPIGTRVMLNPDSVYAEGPDSSNPIDTEGIIYDFDGYHEYSVKWDNGESNNSYKIGEDLIILGNNLNQEFYY